jgi:hypothetical protein
MKLTICGFEVAYEQVPFHFGRNVSKINGFDRVQILQSNIEFGRCQ